MIVDDHEVFRDVARELIAAMDGFAVVGEAASGEAALMVMDELHPEFVVMDVRMPGMGGIAAAAALLERHPGTVVLLVSVFDLTGPAPVGPSGRAVPFVRKEALRKELLREVWGQHTVAIGVASGR